MTDTMYMAQQELSRYNSLKQSVSALEEQLRELDAAKMSIGASTLSAVPVHGGGNKHEDKLVCAIDRYDRVSRNYINIKLRVTAVKRALDRLSADELLIAERFYINRHGDYLRVLCEELHCSQSGVYRMRDNVLRKAALIMFGE